MSNKSTEQRFTTDVAINLLSVVKRNNERFNTTLINSLNDVETILDLDNFNYYRNLKSKFEAELEEYVETGEYGHFTIADKEALDIADFYQDLQLDTDRFTIQEINWFVETVRKFYSSNQ